MLYPIPLRIPAPGEQITEMKPLCSTHSPSLVLFSMGVKCLLNKCCTNSCNAAVLVQFEMEMSIRLPIGDTGTGNSLLLFPLPHLLWELLQKVTVTSKSCLAGVSVSVLENPGTTALSLVGI